MAAVTVAGPIDLSSQANEIFDPGTRPMLPYHNNGTATVGAVHDTATNVIAVASDEAEKAAAATCAAVPVKGGYFFWGSDAHSPAFTRSPAYFNKCMLTLSSVDERGVTTVHGYYPPARPPAPPALPVPDFGGTRFRNTPIQIKSRKGKRLGRPHKQIDAQDLVDRMMVTAAQFTLLRKC
jgi:hypothetical protein